jgi:hypothetical protein
MLLLLFCAARADSIAVVRAGGVIRLTVGRDSTERGAPAAGLPAFAPNTLFRVGAALGRFMLGAFFNALAGTFAMVLFTGEEFVNVLFGAAVKPPGRDIFAWFIAFALPVWL